VVYNSPWRQAEVSPKVLRIDSRDGDAVSPEPYQCRAFLEVFRGDLLVDEQVDDQKSGRGTVVVAGCA
jgi:hypothetical protein